MNLYSSYMTAKLCAKLSVIGLLPSWQRNAFIYSVIHLYERLM